MAMGVMRGIEITSALSNRCGNRMKAHDIRMTVLQSNDVYAKHLDETHFPNVVMMGNQL